jgi:hypothetical protein
MEFMTVKEASTKWGLSERRLQTICNEGMIPGVTRFGRSWAIPVDAQKPVDKRIKSGKYIKALPLIHKSCKEEGCVTSSSKK